MKTVSRRTVVTSGAAVAAVAAFPLADAESASARPTGATRLSWSVAQPSHLGKRVKGAATAATAQLLDAAGHEVGTLRATGVHSDSGGSGNLTTQVLQLGHDTVVGVGVGDASSLEGVYAVVGGTGAHLGARGSYTIQGGALRLTLLP